MSDDRPILLFRSSAELEVWLDEQHQVVDELWVKLAKKKSLYESISYEEAVEVAMCFGWIDSQSRTINEDFWMQRFTPRRRRSNWSKPSCELATRLIEEGRMRPAGLEQVEAAKRDGRWK